MKLLKLCLLVPLMVACNANHSTSEGLLSGNLREEIGHASKLSLQDEIESVEYVPLQSTDDPASLIDGIAEYALTSKYIYVCPVKEARIVLFDRHGHFLKTLIPFGQGPGEFSGIVASMQADEKNNRLYLFTIDRFWVYTLEGEFIESVSHNYMIAFQRRVGKEQLASVALPYMPFNSGSFGLGLFTEKGDTVLMKNDFSSTLVAPEKTGFTISIAATYSSPEDAVLFKMGANDTVFRVSENLIQPTCVLNLQNSDKEIVRALDSSDFNSLREQGDDADIFVSDLFETPRRYYFRCRHQGGHYVASVDKKTGETLTEKCEQPGTLRELGDANLLQGMLGTKSYQNFPIWGRMEADCLAQVITTYELSRYKEKCSITVPDQLKAINEESNPVFILYKLRKD